MKTIIITILLLSAVIMNSHGQDKVMGTMLLGAGTAKTTSLVFPYPIISGVRGSRDIMTQKAKGVENILLLKANKAEFEETSLSVVTSDGSIYSFLVSPSCYPELSINIKEAIPVSNKLAELEKPAGNSSGIQDAAKIIADKQAFYHIKDKHFDVSVTLQGIYIHEDVLYFQLALKNDSGIAYDISQFRLFIRDQKKTKRTAEQELEQKPIWTNGNIEKILGHSEQTVVVAIPKFTIPDKKLLVLQVQEQNGGRNLSLDLSNKKIIKAKALEK
ncbi:conjugative transposon protein TraN [Pedobacter panaciterrae]|uniref:conjugative transposon protein TraN n=1 Tax=Pedobacter panaciterrae TaxID=363849 RepID=UPI002594E912|nr:conjugative transposon protein TraN [uncultured Pedobacter sp.]